MSIRKLVDSIEKLNYDLAMQTAVFKAFPNAKIHRFDSVNYRRSNFGQVEFTDKSVNQIYNKFEFEKNSQGVWVVPYCEVQFEFNGKIETVKVHSSPKKKRLVYLSWNRKINNYIIKFSRIAINFKNNDFKEDILNHCRAEMMEFVRSNGKYKIDDTHLEPRLKKLLVFT